MTMKRHPKPYMICILVLCLLAPLSLFLPGSVQASQQKVTLLHMNDLHGHIEPFLDKSLSEDGLVGGAPYFAAMIHEETAKNPEGTLLLAAGDMFQGTPVSNVFHGRPVMEVMNSLEFDASSIGNHEFDWGREVLASLMASARFPFLAANIQDSSGAALSGTVPYRIFQRKGLKIAVVGLTTTETPFLTKPVHVADLGFLDPVRILPGILEEVRNQGAGLVVILSHLGLEADKELAEAVPGIDVIVGGHSHTVVTDPVVVRNTIIVQAGSYGGYLGVLELDYDTSSGKVGHFTKTNELKPVHAGSQHAADAKTAEITAGYAKQIKDRYSRTVGTSTVDLVRKPSEESNIGDLITDAMRSAAEVDIAFHNGGGIRADLPAGPITLDAIYTLLPFNNNVVSMDLTGSQVYDILRANVTSQRQSLQFSGIRVTYGPSGPSGGLEIQALVGEKPLDRDKLYRIATNDYLASGGDGLQTFKQGRNATTGDLLTDILTAYLEKHSPVSPAVEGRIVFNR